MPEQKVIERGYEAQAIRLKPMVVFLLFFWGALAVIFVGIRYFYRGRNSELIEETVVHAPELEQPLQPSPHHASLPWEDMAALRAEQEKMLNSGGAIANDPGHVRIPIDEAMKKILQSGELKRAWVNTTQPWIRPRNETMPSVENRT